MNDGSTADYYQLPAGATELQDLISHRDMNFQIGNIFKACYRYGQAHHSSRERDLRKIIFYARAELAAFPFGQTDSMTGHLVNGWGSEGMTLRDYFAAKAMQAAATNPIGADGFTFEQRAEWAYSQADAMLAQR